MKTIIIILLIIAYISLITEGFIHGTAEGLERLGIVSLSFVIFVTPFLSLLNKDDDDNY